MRILHVTDCYLPRLGGIESHVADLVAQQRSEGHDARVLTPTPSGTGAADPDWVTRVSFPRVSVTGAGGATRQVLDALAGADVVHAHVSVFSPFAFGIARRAASRDVPTLVTVHSLSRKIQRFALFVTLATYDSLLAPAPHVAREGSW